MLYDCSCIFILQYIAAFFICSLCTSPEDKAEFDAKPTKKYVYVYSIMYRGHVDVYICLNRTIDTYDDWTLCSKCETFRPCTQSTSL